ncbi:MAG: hydrolase [Clostridiales Family XIII bacterium]|jgi:nicotinamidase-related amidase|nr:hydrolase [Clostridiales Family XIII bacterium]
MKLGRIRREDAVLVVVDLQERLVPAMSDGGAAGRAALLIRGCEVLGVPFLATQQYTKGLGDTVSEVREAAVSFHYIEKSAFSVMGDAAFAEALKKSGRKTVLLCGAEAHVCVLQSALDMIEEGYAVFLAADAISSRKKRDEDAAVRRMVCAGAVPVTAESALFELLDNDSRSDTFKAISKLVK